MRWLGVLAVVFLLVSLIAGLVVVFPGRVEYKPNQPRSEAEAFLSILRRKSTAMNVMVVVFGLGIACLGVALVIALLLIF